MKSKKLVIAALLLTGGFVNSVYAQYPVSAHVGPNADSYVRDGAYANTNYGNSGYLETRSTSNVGYNRAVYFRYDVSLASPTVQSAKIRIYGSYSGEGYVPVGVFSVASNAWDEGTITWNNSPVNSYYPLATTYVSSAAQFWEWDVTNYVRNQRIAGKTELSFALINQATTPYIASWSAREAFYQYPELEIINVYVGKGEEPVATTIQAEEVASETELLAYPNPASKNIALNFKSNQAEKASISILDVSSRKVASYDVNTQIGTNTVNLDLPTLENGIYFLLFDNGAERISKRITIEN